MPTDENEERTLTQRAEELRQETAALNSLLSGYASKTDVQNQLAAERQRTRELISQRDRNRNIAVVAVALALIVIGLLVFGLKQKTDDIVATRASSRLGLCFAIDDMRVKHNHFVNTAIDERQSLITATDMSTTATAEQKAANRKFFQGQIDNYRRDLLTIIDCNDPKALSSLFTKPGGNP